MAIKFYQLVLLHFINISLTVWLTACSSGGGSGNGDDDGSNGDSGSETGLPSELLIDANRISPILSLGSDLQNIYLASQFELSKYNKVSGIKEVLTGNLINPQLNASCGETGYIEFAKDMIKDGEYLYYHSAACERIQRIYTGNDGLSAIETIVPQAGLGNCCQLNSVAGNDDQLFWVTTSGLETSYVYSREFSSSQPSSQIMTFKGVARLRATESELYISTTDPLTGPTVFKYDLLSQSIDPIQQNVTLDAFGEIPSATSSSHFYWVDGSVIYRVVHGSIAPEVFISGLGDITQISADDTSLYALQGTLVGSNTIYKIDIDSKISTPIVALSDIRDLLVYNGELYWVSAFGLYRFNGGGPSTELYINDGSELLIGGAGGAEMVAVAGKIVVSAGVGESEMLFHDVGSGTNTIIQPIGNSFKIFANSSAVYYGTGNTGILKIPPNLDLRYPETLLGNLAFIEKMFLENGWLYWSEFSNFAGVYRISRMRTDGSQYQVLFDKIHRGLALYDGRLYFMCESACSLPDWTLVSMLQDGTGGIVPEYVLGLGPAQMIENEGAFYVADTADFTVMSILSINLALNDDAEILSGLTYKEVILETSPKWLYELLDGDLKRHRIEEWNKLGSTDVIDPSSDPLVFVSAIHTDDSNLYYWLWKEGFKKLPE